MPHFYPVVIPGGRSLSGDSLGFHAYSLRIDNLTNQWLLEETSLSWIPPYSLGVCLRLYGTGVGIILNQAPVGQPQLTPLTGEQAVGVYSDQLRTEVAGTPVRQFSAVQAVSDITQGAQPALPPVGISRIWADNTGQLHYIQSNGTDATILSTANYASYVAASPLGGDLYGTINAAHIRLVNGAPGIQAIDSGGTARTLAWVSGPNTLYINNNASGATYWQSAGAAANLMVLDNGGNLTLNGGLIMAGASVGGTLPGRILASQAVGGIGVATPFDDQLEVQNAGSGAAKIGFHRTGVYAIYLGLDTDNVFKLGGWSFGATANRLILGDSYPNSGVIQCSGPFVVTGGGYVFQAPNTNNSLYWDNASLFQITCVGNPCIYRFYAPTMGYYSDITLTGNLFNVASGGTTTTVKVLHLNGPNDAASPMQSWILGTSSAGAGNVYCPATSIPSIRAGKSGLEILPDSECLTRVLMPEVHAWRYKNTRTPKRAKDAADDVPDWPELDTANGVTVGFLADEMIGVLPEVVATADDDPFGLHYAQITSVLWGAIRELESRVKALEPQH